MRLLNIRTMKLEEYFGAQIPPYAILSHCWSTEEVTFADINGPNWRNMRGATKIESASSQCRFGGTDHIWIDTCCIDKSSSAELSEAINSMFSWYGASRICYAYLEDVDHITGGRDEKDIAIGRSRWFTRGWTLQELIAPHHISFYNRHWTFLGDKKSLSRVLSSVTTIPKKVLADPSQIRSCSVARKLSWAAERQTTREEDIAYSLLGIFEVNMPLLYGEGIRAFIRLQEEILKETEDQSLFAWGLTEKSEELALSSRRSIWGYRTAGVLAKHPAYFAKSANIVPFPSQPDRQPYSMTNRGLRIELPLLKNPDSHLEPVAILQCHYENDPSRVIGIYVRETTTSSVFSRALSWRGRHSIVLNTLQQNESADVRTIYITKHISDTHSVWTWRCFLRWGSFFTQIYEVLQVVGNCFWNHETKVLELLITNNNEGSASIVFGNHALERYIVVTLSVRKEEHSHRKALPVSVEIVAKPQLVGLSQWLEDLNKTRVDTFESERKHQALELPPHFGGFAPPLFPLTISATATERKILKENIIVLEIRFVGVYRQAGETADVEQGRIKKALLFGPLTASENNEMPHSSSFPGGSFALP